MRKIGYDIAIREMRQACGGALYRGDHTVSLFAVPSSQRATGLAPLAFMIWVYVTRLPSIGVAYRLTADLDHVSLASKVFS